MSYYQVGYTYIPKLEDWDYCIQRHEGHYDIRLYCPEDSKLVYSWSAKKNPITEKNILVRRTYDHEYSRLEFKSSNIETLKSGTASLVEFDKNILLFRTSDSIFYLKNISGKKYLWVYLPQQ